VTEGRAKRLIDTQIGKSNKVQRKLHRSVVTKWEVSDPAKISVFKSILLRSSPMVMNLA